MKTTITLILFLISITSYCQDWQKRIVGCFHNSYVDTYTKVIFNKDSTFTFDKTWDIGRYSLKGIFHVNGDTLILNSQEVLLTPDNKPIRFNNEKWIIIDENKIYQGVEYNSKTIYVGGILIRKTD